MEVQAMGKDIGEVAGIGNKGVMLWMTHLKPPLRACDVVIDFTTPESSIWKL